MNKKVKVFSGSSNIELSKKIANILDIELGKVEIEKFADGEILPKFIDNVRGNTVFIIQSTYPPFENYWELFQMIDAAKRSSAKEIIPIIVYYGYSRQDRKDQPRVSIGSKLIQKFIEISGATRLITIDLHADQISSFFDIPTDQLYASYLFVPHIKKISDNIIIASPDTGGTKRAKYLSNKLKCDMVICYKQRIKSNRVENMILIGDVKGKDVIIFDDIIDTGGTICKSAELMMEKGANSVRAVITHPILSGNAYKNIEESQLTELIVTDTIPLKQKSNKIKVLSISPLIAKSISNIVRNKSLSELFK